MWSKPLGATTLGEEVEDMRRLVAPRASRSIRTERLEHALAFEVLLVREEASFERVLRFLLTPPHLLARPAHQPRPVIADVEGSGPLQHPCCLVELLERHQA